MKFSELPNNIKYALWSAFLIIYDSSVEQYVSAIDFILTFIDKNVLNGS